MQQIVSKPQPNSNTPRNARARSQSILLVGLIVFAAAGLLMGFTVGALNQPKQHTQTNNGGGPIGIKPTPTPTQAATPTQLTSIPQGLPAVGNYLLTENADGQTVYTFTMQVSDKAGKSIKLAGFTCKIWLIPQLPDHNVYYIPYERISNVASLQKPITGQFRDSTTQQVMNDNVQEVTGLTFDPATTQTQSCNMGQGTWKYTIPTSFPPGAYMMVLLSWGYQHDNWSWRQVNIQKAG